MVEDFKYKINKVKIKEYDQYGPSTFKVVSKHYFSTV